MKIINDVLYGNDGKQVAYYATPNKGGKFTPQYLVMHYTAVTRAQGSIDWFLRKDAKASAHLLIDKDGTITQFAPFNVVTWHAGQSTWGGLVGLNQYSIGIEMVNGGRLIKSGATWTCPVDKRVVPDSEVIMAKHKNETVEAAWQEYTEQQIEAVVEIGTLLMKTYNLKDVVGHDDISPFRKSDPGPAFPMSSFRSRIIGRKNDTLDLYKTSVDDLNIRAGSGTQHSLVADPLPIGTKVEVMKREGNWSFVVVLDKVHNLSDLEGWVFTRYLDKI